MLSKSSKWELGFVHYIAKFTISRFECTFLEIVIIIRILYIHSNLDITNLDIVNFTI